MWRPLYTAWQPATEGNDPDTASAWHLRVESMPATVLIIDDEIHMRRLTARMLELAGYSIIEAASGHQALALIQETRPDLITCDIAMPGMNGLEVLEILKSQPETAEIPVIMLTAVGDEKDAARATHLGAADYITKPFSSTNLVETIERHLAARQY
jgi:CheY-like chemotaxis protein